MLSPERVELDRSFFEARLRDALELRRRHMPDATSYRLVNSEGDFLSGLVVDRYEDVMVLQISSLGMDQRKSMIVGAIQKVVSPRAILERSETSFRKFEGLKDSNGLLAGELAPAEASSHLIRLNGIRFEVDLVAGHKTGLYLDQQANYQRVSALIPGGQVLDCFTFLGGFALHAARGTTCRVHAIDQSETAIASAQRNAAANELSDRCTFEVSNVFDWLKSRTATGPHEKVIPRFDAIILDPPSFTRTRSAVPDALRGYKEIHLRALKLLKPGGLLATFCCSHHVDAVTFQDVILSAAFDARKILRRVAIFGQSLDHPVIPSIPETEYLKGFAFELVR
jgi:23S rRNA (cytosine1962-C5)-methyltransferase